MCNFVIKAKKAGKDWISIESEYDFSSFGSDTNRDQEHRQWFQFQKSPSTGEFKDAYIIVKFFIVMYDKNSKE